MSQQSENPFDLLGFGDIEEEKRQITEQQKKGERLDILIHRTFEQNESGKELLEMWSESLMLHPTARAGDDMLAIGIQEGIKQFIRNIILTVNKVERGE